MALSYIYNMAFGINPNIMAVIAGAVVIYYTISGGFKAVVQTDFFQGIMQLVLFAGTVYFIFKITGFDVSFVKEQLIAQDPKLWQLMPEVLCLI